MMTDPYYQRQSDSRFWQYKVYADIPCQGHMSNNYIDTLNGEALTRNDKLEVVGLSDCPYRSPSEGLNTTYVH